MKTDIQSDFLAKYGLSDPAAIDIEQRAVYVVGTYTPPKGSNLTQTVTRLRIASGFSSVQEATDWIKRKIGSGAAKLIVSTADACTIADSKLIFG